MIVKTNFEMEILPLTPLDLSYKNEKKITNDQFTKFLKSPIDINDPKPLSQPKIKKQTIQSARTPPKIPIKYIIRNADKAILMHKKSSLRSHAFFEKEKQIQERIYHENMNRENHYESWKLNHNNYLKLHSKVKPMSPTQIKDSQLTEAIASSRRISPY